ncbi:MULTISPECIES: two-component system QseEF-associated lipoprotein QseG [Proteus]|nr:MULTISPECIES: two-component system QseEF-associated lipoprotein QseG [Proteus]MCO8049376.1 two-component system QseEF-associated lipoprotein QseG [Proteus penneri]MCX2587418.1 two-component system QseEF-associated lipoprotein QseG [Proteus penneri]SUC02180.1 Quorum-sensing regulator protein G precursor [Proteus penneri]
MQIRSQKQASPHHEYKKINKKMLGIEWLFMAPASTRKIALNWKQCFLFIMLPLVLSGCTPKSLTNTLEPEQEIPVVKQKTIDYRWAECKTLSSFYDEGINNALYWLRVIECTNRIMTTEAQRQASNVIITGWDDAFYKSILLERAGMTIAERRTQLVLLESYKLQFPSSMRVLLSIWIENQTLILSLAEEKNRYRRLTTDTDNRIDALRKENNALQHELSVTLKKLESLTQIERQLSNRKQSGSVDSLSQNEDLAESATATSAETEKVNAEKTTTEKTVVEKTTEKPVSTQSITEKPKGEEKQPSATAVKPEPSKPESTKAESTKSEAVKSEPVKTDTDTQSSKPTEAGSK